MKISGEVNLSLNLSSYQEMHLSPECGGAFDVLPKFNDTLTVDAIGPVNVPVIPYVHCAACGATYIASGFREKIEKIIANHLVFGTIGLLKKEQIRFLRLYFGKTQEEFANGCGVSDRHEMSKIESTRFSEIRLSPDKQVRLRFYCAELFGNESVAVKMNHIDESALADFSQIEFPGVDDLKIG
jgi:DNA-binding XRE family transcriptional regulator